MNRCNEEQGLGNVNVVMAMPNRKTATQSSYKEQEPARGSSD